LFCQRHCCNQQLLKNLLDFCHVLPSSYDKIKPF
jgi:hypothetical protein